MIPYTVIETDPRVLLLSPPKFSGKISWPMREGHAYTLLEKGCCTPAWSDRIDMDRNFVLSVGWKWQVMYLWLLPNEIRRYLGQTFTSMPSGIVEVQNRNLGGHPSKYAFALWQVRINNRIFFSQFSVIILIMLRLTPIGIRHEVLVRECMWQSAIAGRVDPSTTSSGGMLPLELWCQAIPRGLIGRPHLVKTVLCWGWSDRGVGGNLTMDQIPNLPRRWQA